MKIILLAAIVLLLLGPLRRRLLFPFLTAWWRTVIPLVAGGIVGHVVVSRFMRGAPPWMMLVGPFMGAFGIGGAIRELLANTFPERRERNAR
jgi:hypothetical protein